MNTSHLIYEATTKKLLDFKDINKFTSSYLAAFDKFAGLLTKTSLYTWQNIMMYFQAIILMNIGPKYS